MFCSALFFCSEAEESISLLPLFSSLLSSFELVQHVEKKKEDHNMKDIKYKTVTHLLFS